MPTPGAAATGTTFNLNTPTLTASGGGASGTQDWYVHVQTVDIMYQRNNQYDSSVSNTFTGPTITSNWMDINYTVQTQDEIYYDTQFSSTTSGIGGELFEPHVLQLITNTGVSGGFGTNGVVNTSSMGIIRRPARKDAAGTILDPTGICTQNGSLVVDQMPGSFDITYDTSDSTGSILGQVAGQLSQVCPTFKSTLVRL